jgi:hypothetical protein
MTILLILFAVLSAADGLITNYALNKGLTELNPVVRGFIKTFGQVPGLAILKVAPVVFLYFLVLPDWFVGAIDAGYVGLLGWNLYQLNKK